VQKLAVDQGNLTHLECEDNARAFIRKPK